MEATVCLRGHDGGAEDHAWTSVTAECLQSASPWRTFRWYKGQKHYSGTYWSATVGDHVIYESRLELTRLLFADFDPSVHGIVAQPFLLKAEVEGQVRRHVPDYLLVTNSGQIIVDVKPRRQLSSPVVAFTFEWTRRAVESRGWRHEVWRPSRRMQGRTTSVSWLATAGSGCSSRSSWRKCGAPTWTAYRWDGQPRGCPVVPSPSSELRSITCCGLVTCTRISVGRFVPPAC